MSEQPSWFDHEPDDVVPRHPSLWAYEEETGEWIDLLEGEEHLWW